MTGVSRAKMIVAIVVGGLGAGIVLGGVLSASWLTRSGKHKAASV